MTRNQRIASLVERVERVVGANSRWVTVSVAPGHQTEAQFATLCPKDIYRIEQLLQGIRDEVVKP